MATDMFLEIDDVKGESVDSKFMDHIEVQSWSWGMTQSGSSHTGTGGGSAKVSVHDLSVVKYVDKATPNLMKMCCSGKHFGKAVLSIRKAGGEALVYAKLTLEDGIISGVSSSGGAGDERLSETITLNFARYTYEYNQQANTGGGKGVVTAKWNIAKNSSD